MRLIILIFIIAVLKVTTIHANSPHICNKEQPIEFLKEKALEFYNQEKFKDTFICSLSGAQLNDPYSTGILGWHFQFGIGTDIDLDEANKWYKKGITLVIITQRLILLKIYQKELVLR